MVVWCRDRILKEGGHSEEGDKATSIWWIRDQFSGCSDSLESVFGSTSIAPSEMTKKIWSYVKRQGLAKKH